MHFEFDWVDKNRVRQFGRGIQAKADRIEQEIIFESVKIQPEEAVEELHRPRQKPVELFRDEVYECGFCKGTGEKQGGAICPVCKGKKQIRLTPPVVKCAACKGKGEERPRSNITCTPCRGTGWIAVMEPIEKCRTCRGRGRTSVSNLPCVPCKGAGVVTVKIR